MRRHDWQKLMDFAAAYLKARGVGEEEARTIADVAVRTEAMGIHTHGLAVFPYFEQNIPANIDPAATPKVVKEKGATALIDGGGGFAQLAMHRAREIARQKAASFGVAMVAVRNCGWLGAVGPYLVSLAREGFLAQLWAQTPTCRDCAPYGGIDGKFSTNPVALAFPTREDPVLSDFSTAAISLGKTKRMAAAGKRAPERLFLDASGALSDDPGVVAGGGTLLFLGGANYGYKGYGLSLWCEALAALGGGDCNNPEVKVRQTVNLTVVDPEAFAGHNYFYREIERFKKHMKASRLREGFDSIRLPGERAFRELHRAQQEGVAVDPGMIESLNALAAKHGFEPLPA